VKSLWENLFSAGFNYLKPLCGAIAALNHPFFAPFCISLMFYFLSFFDGKKSCSTYYYINEMKRNKTSKNDIDFLAVLILFFILFYSLFGEEEKKKMNHGMNCKKRPQK